MRKRCARRSTTCRPGRAARACSAGITRYSNAIEERLAAFTGSESALLFGSGYAANIGLLQAVVSPDDLIVSDERNHASLIDGIRLTRRATAIYPHQDLAALETALRTPRKGRAIVVTESVFSMDGDLTPLAESARSPSAQAPS